MESTEMMKMATGEGFPIYEGYVGFWRRNSRSIVLPDRFRVYGYIYAKEIRQGSHEGPTRVEGMP